VSVRITTEVVGLRELDDALRELRKEMAGKEGSIVAQSLMSAALPVFRGQQAQAAAHQKTGDLLRGIKRKRHTNPKYLSELVGVGVHDPGPRPRKGEGRTGKPWYAAIVEFGGWHSSGPLKGFMRRSLEANRERSVGIFINTAGRKIEAAAKKIGNKNLRAVGARLKKL